MKLNARQLREVDATEVSDKLKDLKRKPIYFILENIYDTYNIGGLFRLADALCISKIYLCGQTEIPPNHKIKKASIGTYKIVPWGYCKSAAEAIEKIRQNNKSQIISRLRSGQANHKKNSNNKIQVIAVEQDEKAIPYTRANYSLPLALVVGNETYGVLPETLKLVDQIVEIPMWGINKSLNVIVSAAIVGYFAAG